MGLIFNRYQCRKQLDDKSSISVFTAYISSKILAVKEFAIQLAMFFDILLRGIVKSQIYY